MGRIGHAVGPGSEGLSALGRAGTPHVTGKKSAKEERRRLMLPYLARERGRRERCSGNFAG